MLKNTLYGVKHIRCAAENPCGCGRLEGMARANEQLKAILLAEGRWPDFVRRRDELRAVGMTPAEARKQAEAEFSGGVVGGNEPSVVKSEAPSDSGTDFGALISDFGGKEAPIIDQVLWVARYMDVVDVPKSLCPDPAAWSLLMACRNSPAMKADFWTKMYAKAIPSKIKEDDGEDDGKFDGKEQVDLSRALAEAVGVDEDADEEETAASVEGPEA